MQGQKDAKRSATADAVRHSLLGRRERQRFTAEAASAAHDHYARPCDHPVRWAEVRDAAVFEGLFVPATGCGVAGAG